MNRPAVQVVYANEFDKYARQTYRLNCQIRIWIVVIFVRCSRRHIPAERVNNDYGRFPLSGLWYCGLPQGL